MSEYTSATRYLNCGLEDGSTIFYRSAGAPENPTILLLHGFPASSFQYRYLIPILSSAGYHVIAPDLPGFGFTTVPETYQYTFDHISKSIESFIDALGITKFTAYGFDYGAPTAFRIALRRPELFSALITQNGNAYLQGLGADFWAPLEKYWASNSTRDRDALRAVFALEAIKSQYTVGTPTAKLSSIDPATYNLDYALIQRPGNEDIQLDLFYDYRTNVAMYPEYQAYFKTSKIPTLGVWGKNDVAFIPAGLEAWKQDVGDSLEVHFLDGGHFLAETNYKEIGRLMVDFLKRKL